MAKMRTAASMVMQFLGQVSPVAVVAAFVFIVMTYDRFTVLADNYGQHCIAQDQKEAEQKTIDLNQTGEINMIQPFLIKLDTNSTHMQKDIEEIKTILREYVSRP